MATDAGSVSVEEGRGARAVLIREVALIVVIYLGYRHVRHLARDQSDQAFENARRVVEIERHLHVFTEQAVQQVFIRHDALMWLLNHYYARVHFPLTIIFLIWLVVRHRDAYRMVRTWLITVTLAALLMHVAFPLAPPRMLPSLGFVNTLRDSGLRIYSTNPNDSAANQFAAMPSLHFGWAVIVAAGFVAVRRTSASVLAFLHPVITLIAIVATANHYWIDAGVALVLVIGAVMLVRASAMTSGDPDLTDGWAASVSQHPASVPGRGGSNASSVD
jgi:hypothetical protein